MRKAYRIVEESPLPSAAAGVTYTQTLHTEGGRGRTQWLLTFITPSANFVIDVDTGILTGDATIPAGTYQLLVVAVAKDQSVHKTFTVTLT